MILRGDNKGWKGMGGGTRTAKERTPKGTTTMTVLMITRTSEIELTSPSRVQPGITLSVVVKESQEEGLGALQRHMFFRL